MTVAYATIRTAAGRPANTDHPAVTGDEAKQIARMLRRSQT